MDKLKLILSSLVSNISENKYKINAEKFKQKVVNLGSMLDYFDMVPFVGEDGNVIGIVVTDKDPKSLASLLGFKENDLILKINEIVLTSNKNRIAAYDSVINTPENAEVIVELERDGQKQQNSYIISYKTLKEDTPITTKKITEINSPIASVGTSNVMFPELMAKEERDRSNKLHNENIDRIRRDLIASSIKPRIN
jgi:C-terminal processing protease CtpA/Prc